MHHDDLEQKVMILLKEIDNLSGADKKNALVRFIEQVLEIENATYLLDKYDLTNIQSDAVGEWKNIRHNRKMGGLSLSSQDIQAILWVHGVITCLRRHGLLHRPVDFKWDVEYES